ncbi:unnamed protein product [Penicillium pancosmium]
MAHPYRRSEATGAKVTKRSPKAKKQSMSMAMDLSGSVSSINMQYPQDQIEEAAKFREAQKLKKEAQEALERHQRDSAYNQGSQAEIQGLQNLLKQYAEKVGKGQVLNSQQKAQIHAIQQALSDAIQKEQMQIAGAATQLAQSQSAVHNAEMERLHRLLAAYEQQLAAGQALDADQQELEQNLSLRRALNDELRTADIRENYIFDLESDHYQIRQLGEVFKQRERNLESELEFMKQRVDLLERDLDRLVEKSYITNNRYYNIFCEEIYQWKKLRDLILCSEPKKSFWEKKTLLLSDEAVRISHDLLLRTEYIWSRQLVEQLELAQGGYASFSKVMNFRPLSVSGLYQLPIKEPESDSGSDAEQDNDFKFCLSPDASPFAKSAKFTSLNTFVEDNLKGQSSQYCSDTDEEDSGYMTDMATFSGTSLYQYTSPLGQHPGSNNADHLGLQGFQPRENVPEEVIISRSDKATRAAIVSRKRLNKGPGSHTHTVEADEPLIQLSLGKKRTGTSNSPYTHPDIVPKSSIVHNHVHRTSQQDVVVPRTRSRGQFPERVSKPNLARSSQLKRREWHRSPVKPSWASVSLSEEKLSRIVAVRTSADSTETTTKAMRAVEESAVEYSLAGWIWIYFKRQPRALIQPLVGIAVCVAAMYLIADWRLYREFVAANTASDRMMARMRRAQAEYRVVDSPYSNGQWKKWLDVDRVALQ